jgi:hypothetical protein
MRRNVVCSPPGAAHGGGASPTRRRVRAADGCTRPGGLRPPGTPSGLEEEKARTPVRPPLAFRPRLGRPAHRRLHRRFGLALRRARESARSNNTLTTKYNHYLLIPILCRSSAESRVWRHDSRSGDLQARLNLRRCVGVVGPTRARLGSHAEPPAPWPLLRPPGSPENPLTFSAGTSRCRCRGTRAGGARTHRRGSA